MSQYQKHVFVCTSGKTCKAADSQATFEALIDMTCATLKDEITKDQQQLNRKPSISEAQRKDLVATLQFYLKQKKNQRPC